MRVKLLILRENTIMQDLLHNLRIVINPKIYVKDPQSSDLGMRIVEQGIQQISEIGFDRFTFRKLGEQIGSNESSIYRYFENKHKFLIYLNSWYWAWMEYRLVLMTNSIADPRKKLEKALEVLSQKVEADPNFSYVDEVALNKIVVNEHFKPFLTAEVDEENKQGYFEIYKRLVGRFGQMIRDYRPQYPYALSLASTVLSASLHQYFLQAHFPTLTDCKDASAHTTFLRQLVFSKVIPSVHE